MKLRIGSRESRLAIVQTELVADAIRKYDSSIEIEIVTMKTMGDILLDRRLDDIGGKGLFIKELEVALLKGLIDLCVHSYKDMPMEENPDLPIVALSERENPFDALVLPKGINTIDYSKTIGCSSGRRILQMKMLDPKVEFSLVRGNVLTRLKKLDSGEYSALILASAGLKRLGLSERISREFSEKEMLPSASQGILAVQGHKDKDYGFLNGFNSKNSQIVSKAERAFITQIGGGCTSPNAAFATIEGDTLNLTGMYVHEESSTTNIETITGKLHEAEDIGKKLASKLKGRFI